jgi:hypothetical protein
MRKKSKRSKAKDFTSNKKVLLRPLYNKISRKIRSMKTIVFQRLKFYDLLNAKVFVFY